MLQFLNSILISVFVFIGYYYNYYYWTKRLWWRAVKDCADTEQFRKCVRRCSGPETVRHGRNYRTGKLLANSSVFKFLLNVASDGDEVTEEGKPFHTRAAATGKARSPMVERRVRGTVSASDEDERRRRRVSRSATRWRSLTVEAAVHQHCQFELDPLTNPEPVKFAYSYVVMCYCLYRPNCPFESLFIFTLFVLFVFARYRPRYRNRPNFMYRSRLSFWSTRLVLYHCHQVIG